MATTKAAPEAAPAPKSDPVNSADPFDGFPFELLDTWAASPGWGVTEDARARYAEWRLEHPQN